MKIVEIQPSKIWVYGIAIVTDVGFVKNPLQVCLEGAVSLARDLQLALTVNGRRRLTSEQIGSVSNYDERNWLRAIALGTVNLEQESIANSWKNEIFRTSPIAKERYLQGQLGFWLQRTSDDILCMLGDVVRRGKRET